AAPAPQNSGTVAAPQATLPLPRDTTRSPPARSPAWYGPSPDDGTAAAATSLRSADHARSRPAAAALAAHPAGHAGDQTALAVALPRRRQPDRARPLPPAAAHAATPPAPAG